MTIGHDPCIDRDTGNEEHDWSYHSDWEGDPEVINGTHTFYFRRCEECGKEESCDAGDMPSFDDDGY